MRILLFLLGFLPQRAFAAISVPQAFQQYCSALGSYCGSGRGFLIQLAERVETLVTEVIGGLAVVAFLYGAVRMVFSGIDESGREQGKTIMKVAATGLVLAILAHTIVQFVADFVSESVG